MMRFKHTVLVGLRPLEGMLFMRFDVVSQTMEEMSSSSWNILDPMLFCVQLFFFGTYSLTTGIHQRFFLILAGSRLRPRRT